PDMPGYEVQENEKSSENIKVPAAWLIDHCGFKGYRMGDAGVHKKHALVLVNYGNATGTDIVKLAKIILKAVEDTFGILLEPEVTIIE
ncbi:UDP-N-acetylenolpyruvoylglucosamine reductase, partial [Balneolaceae bacterium ANBcel3]|nr:UDP-N-acetylenolpyruvoylglucosamine reductase [Balneolaceae bacterium ANBcel3]